MLEKDHSKAGQGANKNDPIPELPVPELPMKHQDVYELSKRHGPPKIDLRTAMIMDDYGDESDAKMPISHQCPADVIKEELEYYGWVYAFMEPTDLLFYLYPVALEYEKDRELQCIEGLLYSLDREIEGLMANIDDDDKSALKNGLLWIFKSGGVGYADWYHCENLQELIGIKVHGHDYWESIQQDDY